MVRPYGPCKGWNHTTSPRSSMIIEPPFPAPPFSGARKMYPAAVSSCASVATSTAGGLRSGRERNAHTPPAGGDATPGKGLILGVPEDLTFEDRSGGSQPTAFVSAK